MAKVNVSLPDELLADVDALASELGSSRSGLVREATARYVTDLHSEQAARERETAEMRELAERVPEGPDTTELIRRDRDGDYDADR